MRMPKTRVKPGDVVTLVSGGPEMTVNCEPDDTGQVQCVWFRDDSEFRPPTRPLKVST